MRTVKKNVYYCDHCKKKSLSAPVIRKHECGCTNNPNRICGLCERKEISLLIEEFKKRFTLHPVMQEDPEGNRIGDYFEVEWLGERATLQEIRNAVDNCPNCILSILRQTKMNFSCFELEIFNYKDAVKEWWEQKNMNVSPYTF